MNNMTEDWKKALQRLVDEKGQVEAAKELGISQPHVSDLLKGKKNPGPEVLDRLGFVRIIKPKGKGTN